MLTTSYSDAQIFNKCQLKHSIVDLTIGVPDADELPEVDRYTPYFIVANNAFALRTWFMKPFSERNLTNEERIFNNRLSRASCVVENAFGILANHF